MNADVQAAYERAKEVRALLADVYGATPAAAVVLAPGALAALRLVLGALGAKRVVVTDAEYFDTAAFPAARVDAVEPARLVARVVKRPPDAVLASVVTWKGDRLPLESAFAEIRTALGADAPLLVADFAHAGAAGFPKVRSTHADVVLGDVTKWITPPQMPDRLAWLWFGPAPLRRLAERLFAAFYLALPRPGTALQARWVMPEAVGAVAEFRRNTGITRRALLRRARADLHLAGRIARWCGAAAPSSALVWIATEDGAKRVPPWVASRGLLWQPSADVARVMCRSDLAP